MMAASLGGPARRRQYSAEVGGWRTGAAKSVGGGDPFTPDERTSRPRGSVLPIHKKRENNGKVAELPESLYYALLYRGAFPLLLDLAPSWSSISGSGSLQLSRVQDNLASLV
ncbi:hypothetical protein L1987_83097 [Smallanthus sonchifolius]|uniref:Uncharacterized protein n=1 Tax=Smallanthus sonchifolius TaxID=185202 RepID=A0ACB8YBJ4_9ASTR|nr:hypothetical protein L1987_83097 [Smallanthus sonchifolius]